MSEDKPSITTLYYRNPYLLVMTMAILVVAGVSAFFFLPRQEDPRITLRNVGIITFLPGASAERIEALINEKIEEELDEIAEIKEVESTARANVSFVQVELNDGVTEETNQEIISKIRNRMKTVESRLPAGATAPFVDDKRGAVAYTFVAAVQWRGEGAPPLNLLNRLALELKDQFLLIPRTEVVRLFGGVQEEITVIVDPGELAALGLSAEQVAQFVEKGDSKVSAGQLRGDRLDLKIEVEGRLDSLERIANIPIVTGNDGVILKLGDIARLERSYQKPVEEIGLFQNERAIFVAARTVKDARVDYWTEDALKVVKDFSETLDSRFSIEVIFNQNDYTTARLADLFFNLVAGAAIIVGIVFLTMGWKSGLIVGMALPLSICGALFSLSFFDEGIHQMSIFGLIIAIGLLIDTAIVVTDEVRKRRHRGAEPIQAMDESVRYLFVPLLTSTFTTILGFMPIFLLPGNAGDFVGPIAISVVTALTVSFFLSMTVIPALTARFTHAHQEGIVYGWMQTGLPSPKIFEDFQSFLLSAMKRPVFFLCLSVIPSLIGFVSISTMPVEFFPGSDRDMFEIKLWATEGSSLEHTLSLVKKTNALLGDVEGIDQVQWLIGGSIPPVYYNQVPLVDRNSSYAQAVIVAESAKKATRLISSLQDLLNRKIPEGQFVVQAFGQGPPADSPIAFRILGPQLSTLNDLGEQVRAVMAEFPEVTQSRATISGGEPKLWLLADEFNAQQAGLRLRDIAGQFEGNLEGFAAGSVLEDVEELPVRVRISSEERGSLDAIRNLKLVSPNVEGWIPTLSLGPMTLKPELGSITRFNGVRANNIQGFIKNDATAVSVAGAIYDQLVETIDLPPGYSLQVTGESEQQAEAIDNLLLYAPVIVILMVTALVLAFKSAAMALIIGSVGILSIGLGMLALKISGYPLGFNPLIGSIGLLGVAINDTIVVLSAIHTNEKAKKGKGSEIVAETLGCGRHVLSTTFTTFGGFIPLLLLSGGTFWPPLSVVIAGGIAFSLILAMFFTPLAYKVFADWTQREETG